jgi:hypothetical protein
MTDTIEKTPRIQIQPVLSSSKRPRLRAKIWEELRELFRRYENTADTLKRRKVKEEIKTLISLLGICAAVAAPLIMTEAALPARAQEQEHAFSAFSDAQENDTLARDCGARIGPPKTGKDRDAAIAECVTNFRRGVAAITPPSLWFN